MWSSSIGFAKVRTIGQKVRNAANETIDKQLPSEKRFGDAGTAGFH